jgi:EmrB/QacA subfamily drug resistance transporter
MAVSRGSVPEVRQPGLATAGPPIQAVQAPDNYKWVAAAVVIVGAVMTILDQTVVNVALSTLEKDFNATLSDIQWVVTAYSLALAAVIPMAGWLSDRFGAKKVFFTSQLLFTIGSALCGLAWSNSALIVFRVLQGLGGGLIMPVGMAILMRVSRPDERGRLMAVMGVPMLLGPALGPTLGGWLIQSYTWRLIFYINVPIGIVGSLLSILLLREVMSRQPAGRIDLGGLALVTPAVLGMVYGLSQPSTYGWWSGQTLIPLLGGTALLALFCLYELRQEQPLIDIRVFRDAAFSAAMVLSTLIGFGLFAAMVLLPLFLQQVQGYGAFDAGLILAAQGIGAAVVMPASGILTDRLGAAKVVPVGLVAITASSLWLTTVSADTAKWDVVWMLVLRGVGMGLTMMPAMASAYVTLRPHQIARATSVGNVIQRVSSGFGVAVMATILSNRITANLPAMHASGAPGGHIPAAVKAYLLEQVAKGYDQTFWFTVGIMLLGFPAALFLGRALRPQEIRTYAMKQFKDGFVLGMAARRVRDGPLNGLTRQIDVSAAYRLLASSATQRLQAAAQLIQMGPNAAGLVPRKALSFGHRVAVGLFAVGAAAGLVISLAQAFQTPTIPNPPGVQSLH